MTSMKSTVMKRSIMDFGRRTSISLDEPFLSALKACGFESRRPHHHRQVYIEMTI